jgi:integrase
MPNEYRIGRLNGGYVVTWWEGGKRRRYRLDAQSRAEAESEAITVVKRELVVDSKVTIGDLWQAYRKEKDGRRIAVTMGFEWKVMEPFFGNLRPHQLTVDHCRAYTGARRAMKKHDGTIWTELGHLRTVLNWALKGAAPTVERPAKPPPKERWLTEVEIGKLLAVPKAHHIQLAILLMLSTAGRIGAILELEWERVDMERGTVNLRTTETGPRKGRAIVPMNAGLKAALTHADAIRQTGHVVEWAGSSVGSIKTGFKAAVKAAGLAKVTPHTLRHTAAVHMAAAGRPMSKIAQYLGHSNTHQTEKVYARYAPDHLREEADILDFATRAKVV